MVGYFLDKDFSSSSFAQVGSSPYFVDKSWLLAKLFPLIGTNRCYIAVSRPPGCGKTMAAEMIASFFGKIDSRAMFENLNISADPYFARHINGYHVLHMDLAQVPNDGTYRTYLGSIVSQLQADLEVAFPNIEVNSDWEVVDHLFKIQQELGDRFIFVIDNWDYIFHAGFASEADQESFRGFLCTLLKDQGYVELAYLTGVHAVGDHQYLNFFTEDSLFNGLIFGEDFGFTEPEMQSLLSRVAGDEDAELTLDKLRQRCGGYWRPTGKEYFCPQLVSRVISSRGGGVQGAECPWYTEVADLVASNVPGVREKLDQLMAGESVSADVGHYYALPGRFIDQDDVLSELVVLGALSNRDWKVVIPNLEMRRLLAQICYA